MADDEPVSDGTTDEVTGRLSSETVEERRARLGPDPAKYRPPLRTRTLQIAIGAVVAIVCFVIATALLGFPGPGPLHRNSLPSLYALKAKVEVRDIPGPGPLHRNSLPSLYALKAKVEVRDICDGTVPPEVKVNPWTTRLEARYLVPEALEGLTPEERAMFDSPPPALDPCHGGDI